MSYKKRIPGGGKKKEKNPQEKKLYKVKDN